MVFRRVLNFKKTDFLLDTIEIEYDLLRSLETILVKKSPYNCVTSLITLNFVNTRP